jgi:hypothetical protein
MNPDWDFQAPSHVRGCATPSRCCSRLGIPPQSESSGLTTATGDTEEFKTNPGLTPRSASHRAYSTGMLPRVIHRECHNQGRSICICIYICISRVGKRIDSTGFSQMNFSQMHGVAEGHIGGVSARVVSRHSWLSVPQLNRLHINN